MGIGSICRLAVYVGIPYLYPAGELDDDELPPNKELMPYSAAICPAAPKSPVPLSRFFAPVHRSLAFQLTGSFEVSKSPGL